jgi:UDP-glucuronate decarboxylase
MKTNVLGAFNICEVAKKNNCSLLQASTSEIYGDPDLHPQK